MSKKALALKTKILRKENAIKKTKQKRIMVICSCALVVIAAVVFTVHFDRKRGSVEVYSGGGQTVRLFENGTFSANLAHHVRKSGTYTKITEDNRTTVSFSVNGRIEVGRIENDRLHIPREWDDGHGHGSVFARTR